MAIVGSAQVRITADGTGFDAQIKNILARSTPMFTSAGADANKGWVSGWERNASGGGLEKSLSRAVGSLDPLFTKAGQNNAKSYVSGAVSGIESGLVQDLGKAVQRGTGSVNTIAANQGGIAGRAWGQGFMKTSFSEIDKGASDFAKAFARIYARLAVTGTAMGSLVGTVSALVGGLGQLVIAAGSAASALAGIGPSIGALAQGGIAVGIAFKGIGAAVSAGLKSAKAATDGVAKAGSATATGLINAQRAVADASKRIVDVQIRNARALADANARVHDSEKDLIESQKELADAQKNLNAARKDAIEELQQLAFSAEDAALAEQRAGLSLQDAYKQLQAVQNLPPDNRARQEAELSFKEADLSYREAKDRASDLADAQEQAAKTGIQGTKAYQDAQKGVASAQDKVLTSEKGLADAIKARQRTQSDNARALADAQQNLARQMDDLRRAQAANTAGTSAAAKANQAYADSMDKLSDSGKQFVRYIIQIQGKLNDFKKAIQEPFFKEFNDSFKDLINTVLPALQGGLGKTRSGLTLTSQIMGKMASQGVGALVDNIGLLKSNLEGNNKILGRFAQVNKDGSSAVSDLVTLVGRLYKAVLPLADAFAQFAVKQLGAARAATDTKKGMQSLTDFFDRAGKRMALFAGIFGQLVGIFAGVARAGEGPINTMLENILKSFTSLNSMVANNQSAITQYFKAVNANLGPLFTLVGKVALAFLRLGENANIGKSFAILQEGVAPLEQIFKASADAGPALAKLAVSVVKLFAAFAESGALNVFFGLMTKIVDTITAFLNTPFGQTLILVIGPVIAVFKVISLAMQGLSAAGKLLRGGFLNTAGAIQSIVKSVQSLTDSIKFLIKSLTGLGNVKPPKLPAAPAAGAGGAGGAGGGAAGPTPNAGGVVNAKAATQARQTFAQIALAAQDAFKKAKDAADAAFQQGIEDNAARARGESVGFFADVAKAASSAFNGVKSAASTAFAELPNNAKTAAGHVIIAFDNVTGAITGKLGAIPNAISKSWSALPDLAKTTAGKIIIAYDTVVDGIIGPFKKIPGAAASAFNSVKGAATSGLNNLVGAAVNAQKGVVNAFEKIGPGIRGSLAGVGSLAKSGFKGVGAAASAGFSAARVAADNSLDNIKKRAKDTFDNLGKSAKSGFGLFNKSAKAADDGVGGGKKQKVDIDTSSVEKKGGRLKGLFGGIGGIIGKLGPIIAVVGVVMTAVTAAFSSLAAKSKPVQDAMALLQKTFNGVVKQLASALVPVISMLAKEFQKLAPVVVPVIVQIIGIITKLISSLAKQLVPMFEKMMPVIVNVMKTVFGVIAAVLPQIVPVISLIASSIAKLLPAVMPVITLIVDLIVKFLIPVFKALLPVVMIVINTVIGLFQQLLPIILPIIMMIVDLLTKTLIPVFEELMPIIVQIIKVIIGVIQQLLPVVIPIFTEIVTTIAKLLIPIFQALMPVIITVINAAMQIIKALLPIVLKVFQGIATVITKVVIPIFKALLPVIQWVMGLIADAITTGLKVFGLVWDKFLKPAIDIFIKGFKAIPSFIDGIVQGIGDAWGALVDTVKKPARALLNGINNWLIKPLNSITSKFGLDIPLIPVNFAEGGPVVGPGGPTADKIKANLSNGEFVVRERAARRIGIKNLMHMNKTGALPGGDGSTGGVGGFGDLFKSVVGTVTGVVKDIVNAAESSVGSALTLLYDSTVKPGLDAMKSSGGFIGEFLAAIMEKLRGYMATWGQKRDAEVAAQQAAAAASGDGSGSTTGGMSGSRGVWNALRTGGLTKVQAAGVMGNIQAESGFRWNVVQGGRTSSSWNHGNTGYGLVQWTPSNKLGHILGEIHKPNSLAGQVAALFHQLAGRGKYAEGAAGTALRKATSVLDATRAFMLRYERPGNQSESNVRGRNQLSEHWYKVYANAKIPSAVGGGGGGDTGGVAGGGWVYPLKHRYRITQYPNRGHRPPWAVDIGAPTGTGVLAASAGTLTRHFAGLYTSYGRYITIAHAHGVRTLYAHLNKWIASSGQRVSKGQLIAISGHSGGVRPAGIRGSHLHYELMPSSDTVKAMARRGVKLAAGGVVKSTAGGVLSVIAEAGKNERVEPLDSQGMSVRDRAIIQEIVSDLGGAGGGVGPVTVRVYIGEKELTDIVDYQITASNKDLTRSITTGRRRPS